jgi:hypothetical protein
MFRIAALADIELSRGVIRMLSDARDAADVD